MKRVLVYVLAFVLSIILAAPAIAADYFESGKYHYSKGDYDRAIADYTKAIELDPKYKAAYYNRGNAYYKKGQYDLAIADYTKAIELEPRDAHAYYNRGNAYDDKGQYDLAIADYTKAIELDPRYAKAYNNRGLAYNNKGQYDLAISDFSKAIELDPRYAKAYNNRGLAYNNKGQYDLAIADYTKAIELDPRYAYAYNGRGNVYYKKGQYDLAIADYTKAIELDPKYKAAYYNRGNAYYHKRQYERAISDFTKAIELDPKNADAYRYRELAYKAKSQYNLSSQRDEIKSKNTIPEASRSSGGSVAPTDIHKIPDFKSLPRDNDLAVVIGIENYKGLPRSDFSKGDATLVVEYLKALGFQRRNIEFISDVDATKSGIEKAIEAWLPNRAKKNSRVFVYYSGHGAPEPKTGDAYIVPYDGDPNYLEVTGYPLKRLYEKLGSLAVEEVIVVLDSCFSGAGGRSVLAKGARPLVMMADIKAIPSNMAILSSTQGSQISTSSPEKGHGVFTYYFLKAIKEGKRAIADIYEYIKPLVEDEAKQLNVHQSPSINPDVNRLKGRFLLRR